MHNTGLSLRPHRFRISRYVLENLCHDVVRGDAFGFGLEIQTQSMPQCGGGGGLDDVEADVETALCERADFAGQNEALSDARTGAETEILVGDRRGGFGLGMRGAHPADCVALAVRR